MRLPLNSIWTASSALLFAILGWTGTAQAATGYIASQGTATVRIIDTISNTETASISATGTRNLTLSRDGKRLFSMSSNAIQVVDTAINTIIANVATGNNVTAVAESNNNSLYVCNNAGGTVSIVDATTFTVTATLSRPCQTVVANPNGSKIWISTFGPSPTFTPILEIYDAATNTVEATITTTHGRNAPSWIAFSPDGSRAYAVFSSAALVAVYDTTTNTEVASVATGTAPNYVAVSPNGTYAYVANLTGNSVTVVNTADNTALGTVAVGTFPRAVAFTPDSAYAYVTNFSSNTVSVIDTATRTVATSFATSRSPWGIAIDQDGDQDGVNNGSDNCPFVANSGQADADGDNIGDACDTDMDGDGVANGSDQCAGTSSGAVVDPVTGCSTAQACPCSSPRGSVQPWKNLGKYVACVTSNADSLLGLSLITQTQRNALVTAASKSGCGRK